MLFDQVPPDEQRRAFENYVQRQLEKAKGTEDKGERLLQLNDVNSRISDALTEGQSGIITRAMAMGRKSERWGGFLAAAILGPLAFALPFSFPVALLTLVAVSVVLGTVGMDAFRNGIEDTLIRREQKARKPYFNALAKVQGEAAALTDDLLTGHIAEIAASRSMPQVMVDIPRARAVLSAAFKDKAVKQGEAAVQAPAGQPPKAAGPLLQL